LTRRKLFPEAGIAPPAALAVDVLHQVARQPKMLIPDIPQLRGALVEQLGLTLLAAIGFKHHQLDALAGGIEDDLLHRGAGDRFQQTQISDALRRCKEWVRLNNVSVKTHALLPNTPGVLRLGACLFFRRLASLLITGCCCQHSSSDR